MTDKQVKININNTEISIAEYNRLYHNKEHSVFVEFEKLYGVL